MLRPRRHQRACKLVGMQLEVFALYVMELEQCLPAYCTHSLYRDDCEKKLPPACVS